jgi:hypothetical protein
MRIKSQEQSIGSVVQSPILIDWIFALDDSVISISQAVYSLVCLASLDSISYI